MSGLPVRQRMDHGTQTAERHVDGLGLLPSQAVCFCPLDPLRSCQVNECQLAVQHGAARVRPRLAHDGHAEQRVRPRRLRVHRREPHDACAVAPREERQRLLGRRDGHVRGTLHVHALVGVLPHLDEPPLVQQVRELLPVQLQVLHRHAVVVRGVRLHRREQLVHAAVHEPLPSLLRAEGRVRLARPRLPVRDDRPVLPPQRRLARGRPDVREHLLLRRLRSEDLAELQHLLVDEAVPDVDAATVGQELQRPHVVRLRHLALGQRTHPNEHLHRRVSAAAAAAPARSLSGREPTGPTRRRQAAAAAAPAAAHGRSGSGRGRAGAVAEEAEVDGAVGAYADADADGAGAPACGRGDGHTAGTRHRRCACLVYNEVQIL
eukprot:Rhum_TRINITY_DN12110_c0_g2::Rhum_TRINITY_DN12110_c0_g2_i1::g.49441::m.49441